MHQKKEKFSLPQSGIWIPGFTLKHNSAIEEGLGRVVTKLFLEKWIHSYRVFSICWNWVIIGYPGIMSTNGHDIGSVGLPFLRSSPQIGPILKATKEFQYCFPPKSFDAVPCVHPNPILRYVCLYFSSSLHHSQPPSIPRPP